jgi:membrane protease YdiL (CAAX protease family)
MFNQEVSKPLPEHRVRSCFLLFFFVFGIHQIIDALKFFRLVSGWLENLAYILPQILSICAFIILIKAENSSFQEHGFLIPTDLNGYLSISLILAFVYVLITIFLPGNFMGFEAFPAAPPSYISAEVMSSLLASIASESVFRGYVQKNLTKFYDFIQALLIASVMFALYNFPFFSYAGFDTATIYYGALFFLLEGLFLGFFFQKTRTLICPITFYTTISFLQYFTPLKVLTAEYTIQLFKIMAYIILGLLLCLLLTLRTRMKRAANFKS